MYNSLLSILAWLFLLPITHGKPKCRHAEELLWQTCQTLLPFSCPILSFIAGKMKEHRSSSIQITKICFTPKAKYNSHMPEDPALQTRWGHARTTAYTESIYCVINPGHALLFLKLWTFRNCNAQTPEVEMWLLNIAHSPILLECYASERVSRFSMTRVTSLPTLHLSLSYIAPFQTVAKGNILINIFDTANP